MRCSAALLKKERERISTIRPRSHLYETISNPLMSYPHPRRPTV